MVVCLVGSTDDDGVVVVGNSKFQILGLPWGFKLFEVVRFLSLIWLEQ